MLGPQCHRWKLVPIWACLCMFLTTMSRKGKHLWVCAWNLHYTAVHTAQAVQVGSGSEYCVGQGSLGLFHAAFAQFLFLHWDFHSDCCGSRPCLLFALSPWLFWPFLRSLMPATESSRALIHTADLVLPSSPWTYILRLPLTPSICSLKTLRGSPSKQPAFTTLWRNHAASV